MPIAAASDPSAVDLIEEFRLRRWARENYCYAQARQASWHPVIHDEMRRIDVDVIEEEGVSALAGEDSDVPVEDSTILSDEAIEQVAVEDVAAENSVAEEDVPMGAVAAALGPIVPLPRDLTDLHGPHEITPPHARIAAATEQAEMHYT